jgi:hypothetical protein
VQSANETNFEDGKNDFYTRLFRNNARDLAGLPLAV